MERVQERGGNFLLTGRMGGCRKTCQPPWEWSRMERGGRFAMRLALLALSFLVTGSLVAQSAATQVRVRPRLTYGGQCPVGMLARQEGAGAMQRLWTIALEDQRDAADAALRGGLGVAVELKAAGDHGIRTAAFEVSYLPQGMRVLPIDQAGTAKSDAVAKKTFSLSAGDEGVLKMVGDLLVGRAAMIERVQLVSLTYADGEEWKAMGASCSVVPSRVVLVGAR
jgi:hypothetical protein